jgi:large subunit ribosomal protein L18
MNSNKSKQIHRIRRHRRVRAKILGTAERPRVSIFKSNKNIFVQLIDDIKRKTILSSKVVSDQKKTKGGKVEIALRIGETLGKKAKNAGIKEVVFDRGGFKYHGRVKALADGLRAEGIKF